MKKILVLLFIAIISISGYAKDIMTRDIKVRIDADIAGYRTKTIVLRNNNAYFFINEKLIKIMPKSKMADDKLIFSLFPKDTTKEQYCSAKKNVKTYINIGKPELILGFTIDYKKESIDECFNKRKNSKKNIYNVRFSKELRKMLIRRNPHLKKLSDTELFKILN